NDPQAIGTDLAARQQNRSGIVITAVDGAPDIEAALKDPNSPQIQASASQDPFFMARRAVQVGVGVLNGQKPASTVELLPSKLITRDNVAEYKGWTSDRSPIAPLRFPAPHLAGSAGTLQDRAALIDGLEPFDETFICDAAHAAVESCASHFAPPRRAIRARDRSLAHGRRRTR